MTTLILCGVVIVLLFLVFKYKTATSKPVEQRSALEKILSAWSVKNRQRMEEAAEQIRTPEISREEGIQRCKDAIKQLDSDYRKECANLILTRDNLKDKLPDLKKKPGLNEGKARTSKRKMQECLDKGQPEVAEKHKKNAIMYLELKSRATERIDKSEKFVRDIEVTLDLSAAEYESRRAQLDDMLQEFESMHGAISAAKFNTSIELITSLRRETADKLRAQNAEIEASNRISGMDSASNNVDETAFSEEFDKL